MSRAVFADQRRREANAKPFAILLTMHLLHSLLKRFDESVSLVVKLLPPAVGPLMRTAALVGLPVVIISLALILAAGSWLAGYPQFAYAAIASLVALGGNSIIKRVVHRSRPDTIYVKNMQIQSYSFPSGHAFGAAVFYGLLAYMAHSYIIGPWGEILTGFLIAAILVIGVCRIYLEAHFPSDVLLGWLLGGASLLLIVEVLIA